MSIFLDSVDAEEAKAAGALGFVAGITTNPMLIRKTGKRAEDVISDLCEFGFGVVFHQITATTLPEMEREAERFLGLAPGCVGLKIPCHLDGMRLARQLSGRTTCGITAVYSPAQAYLGSEAGARYVIPYANRAGRQGLNAVDLVRSMAMAIGASGRGCEVLAASIKTPAEAAEVISAGARHLTVPWSVLSAMADHPLTAQTLAEFAVAAGAD